ncbi:MAG: hypothetical protein AB7F64_08665, partial [Gammaproteobacteria bacterium]
ASDSKNVVFVCDVKEALDEICYCAGCQGLHFQGKDSFAQFYQFQELKPIFLQTNINATTKSAYLVAMLCYIEQWYRTSEENPPEQRRWHVQLTALRDNAIEIMMNYGDEDKRLERLKLAIEATRNAIQQFWRGLGSRISRTLGILLEQVISVEGEYNADAYVGANFKYDLEQKTLFLSSRVPVTLDYYTIIREVIVDRVLSVFEAYQHDVVEWREQKLWGWWPVKTDPVKKATAENIINQLLGLKNDNSNSDLSVHAYAVRVFDTVKNIVTTAMPEGSIESAVYKKGHFAMVFCGAKHAIEPSSSLPMSVFDRVVCTHEKESSEYLFVMIYQMHHLYLHPEVTPRKKQTREQTITRLRDKAFEIMKTVTNENDRRCELIAAIQAAKAEIRAGSGFRALGSRLLSTLCALCPEETSPGSEMSAEDINLTKYKHILSTKTVELDPITILREDLVNQFLKLFEAYEQIVDDRKNSSILTSWYKPTTDLTKVSLIQTLVSELKALKSRQPDAEVQAIPDYLSQMLEMIRITIYDKVGTPGSVERINGHFEQGKMGDAVKAVDALMWKLKPSATSSASSSSSMSLSGSCGSANE